ncbi:hypothetical protein [Actinocorallia populi]|uniref:hypothetical protein n=1 Tax=Actinocorallia populi TaxID=2079200 RepID=UPI001E4EF34E|nr:hypothetical protein [Actinocorallia populi]
MTPATTPYRPGQRAERYGFLQLLHAEWTKFRTVRGWAFGMVAAALMVVLVALLAGTSSDQKGSPSVPIGPGGEPVTDSFYFMHRPLAGNGSITVSVSALRSSVPAGPADLRPGTVPWAKAGIIIKQSTRQGSPYAAIMVTGSHGVRMQDDYVNDTAGLPGPVSAASVRWLRLDRSDDTITGYASADGARWTKVGAVHVRGLGPTAQGGLFVASPPSVHGHGTRVSVSTAVFEDLRVQGHRVGGDWTGDQVGRMRPALHAEWTKIRTVAGPLWLLLGMIAVTVALSAGAVSVVTCTSAGCGGDMTKLSLIGVQLGQALVAILAVLVISGEYGSGLIRTTLTAMPHRATVLAAKAIVLAGVVTAAGTIAVLGSLLAGRLILPRHGFTTALGHPALSLTDGPTLRATAGSILYLILIALFSLGIAAIVRDSATGIGVILGLLYLPPLFSQVIGDPDWQRLLQQMSPMSAGLAVQTTADLRDLPLSPWAGLGVTAGWAAAALMAGGLLIRMRDA